MSYLIPVVVLLSASICVGVTNADFAHDVAPILQAHCVQCHGGNEAQGGFSMNTRELFLESDAAVPGKPESSHFLELIGSADQEERMPPVDQPGLSPAEIKTLREWVASGMDWDDGLTFSLDSYQAPLRLFDVSLLGPDGWHPIDQLLFGNSSSDSTDTEFVHATAPKLPARVAANLFVRRVSLDLVGLLPDQDQLRAFTGDSSRDRHTNLIESLLARDLDYAEHWLTFWNDLLRNDYTGTGFITGGRKQITNWLYAALVRNEPYDEFTRQLIAPPTDASTGFIDGIKWRGEVSAGQTLPIQFSQSVSQAFLGINMKCASCHDSFIDQWKLDDAYGLAAVYANEPLDVFRCDKPTGRQATAAWLFPELGSIDAAAPRAQRLSQLANLMTSPDNARFARTISNRIWGQLFGRGLIHPLDAMHLRPENEALLELLAHRLVDHGYDLKDLIRFITTSRAYQTGSTSLQETDIGQSTETPHQIRSLTPTAKRMTAEQFVDNAWRITGTAPIKFDAPIIRSSQSESSELPEVTLQAGWIWGESAAAGQLPPGNETVTLRYSFDLAADVDAAIATVTADNAFQLFIGNRLIARSEDWTKPQAIPLTGLLKKGKNTLVIVATNYADRPNLAGVYFEARVRLSDGSETRLRSGTDWQSSSATSVIREDRLGKTPGPWKPATIVSGNSVHQARVGTLLKQQLATLDANPDKMVRAALMKNDFLMRTLGRPGREQIVSSRAAGMTTLEAIELSNGADLAYIVSAGAENLLNRTSVDRSAGEDHATFDHAAFSNSLFRRAFGRNANSGELEILQQQLGRSPTSAHVEDVIWSVLMSPEFWIVR